MDPKTIRREYLRFYRLAFPEAHRLLCAKWARRHKSQVRHKDKRYRERHRTAIQAKNKKWRENHPHYHSNWWYRNSLKSRSYGALRRARKIKTQIGPITAIRRIYIRAAFLRQWFDVVVDHIIPLSKGGSHTPRNLQIIYRIENLRKGARLDYTPAVIFT